MANNGPRDVSGLSRLRTRKERVQGFQRRCLRFDRNSPEHRRGQGATDVALGLSWLVQEANLEGHDAVWSEVDGLRFAVFLPVPNVNTPSVQPCQDKKWTLQRILLLRHVAARCVCT